MFDVNSMIAANIVAILKKQNRKQIDLAGALQTNKQTISKMLNGSSTVSYTHLVSSTIFTYCILHSLVFLYGGFCKLESEFQCGGYGTISIFYHSSHVFLTKGFCFNTMIREPLFHLNYGEMCIRDRLRTEMGAERMLAEVLEPLKSRYDYILIDTCPSLGMLTINALATADEVIITVNPQLLAMMGLQDFLRTVAKIKKRINPKLEVAGILLTMCESSCLLYTSRCV